MGKEWLFVGGAKGTQGNFQLGCVHVLFQSSSLKLLFLSFVFIISHHYYYYYCVCMCIAHVHPQACKHVDMLWHAYGAERTTLQAWFAPFTLMWDEGMELRFSALCSKLLSPPSHHASLSVNGPCRWCSVRWRFLEAFAHLSYHAHVTSSDLAIF